MKQYVRTYVFGWILNGIFLFEELLLSVQIVMWSLVAHKSQLFFQLSYALITAVFIYFVLLVTTRLIQGKPKHVLEHKQKTETILEAKRNEIREQKRREGTFKTQTIYNLDGER